MATRATQTGYAGPANDGGEEESMGAARRCGVSGDTALQVGLALLCVVLSALAWLPLLDAFAPGG